MNRSPRISRVMIAICWMIASSHALALAPWHSDKGIQNLAGEAVLHRAVEKILEWAKAGDVGEGAVLDKQHRRMLDEILESGMLDISMDHDGLRVFHDKSTDERIIFATTRIQGNPYQIYATETLIGSSTRPGTWEKSLDLKLIPIPPEAKPGSNIPLSGKTKFVRLGAGSSMGAFLRNRDVLKIPFQTRQNRFAYFDVPIDLEANVVKPNVQAKRTLEGIGYGTTILYNVEIPADQFDDDCFARDPMHAYRIGDKFFFPWAVYQDAADTDLFSELKRIYPATILHINLDRIPSELYGAVFWAVTGRHQENEYVRDIEIPLIKYLFLKENLSPYLLPALEKYMPEEFGRARDAAHYLRDLMRDYFSVNRAMLTRGILNLDMNLKDYGVQRVISRVKPFDYGAFTNDPGFLETMLSPREGMQPMDALFAHWDEANGSQLHHVIGWELKELFQHEARLAHASGMQPWWKTATHEARALPEARAMQDILPLTPDNFRSIHAGLVSVKDQVYEILISPLVFWDADSKKMTSNTFVKVVREARTGDIRVLKHTSTREAKLLGGLDFPYIIRANTLMEEGEDSIVDMPYVGDPRYAGQRDDPYEFFHYLKSKSREEQIAAWRKILAAFKYLHQEKHFAYWDTFGRHIRFDLNGNPILFDFDQARSIFDDLGWVKPLTKSWKAVDEAIALLASLREFFPGLRLTQWEKSAEYLTTGDSLQNHPAQVERLREADEDPGRIIDYFIEDVEAHFKTLRQTQARGYQDTLMEQAL